MSRWVCKLCVIQKGLKGADLDQWPEEVPSDAWIAEHLRTAHGVEVREATDTEQRAALIEASLRWVPFEERPRPPELGAAQMMVDQMKTITIVHEDEAALGRIAAWLMGQMHLAKQEVDR